VSPEQITAVLGGLAAVIGAFGVLVAQVASLRKAVDGRLTELVEATRASAQAQGELVGRRRGRAERGRVLDEPPPYLPSERPRGPHIPQE
jgi:hypothetical protein